MQQIPLPASLIQQVQHMEMKSILCGHYLRNGTAQTQLVDLMSRAWASFVVDLDPNNHGLQGIPKWENYTSRLHGAGFVFGYKAPIAPGTDARQWSIWTFVDDV